nr:ribonuclease H-like domain-containing protein [Tanacetum cinerariifolium]
MNGARPNRTSFNKHAHSYANRPFHRTSAVRSHYRAPWVPTVNRSFPPVNKKLSTGSRNFPTANRKFPTASRKFPAGSTKCSTADMRIKGKVVKPLACWFWKPSQNLSNKGPNNNSVSVMFKKYTYIDTQGRLNGCSRHMTGNISYLFDFEPFDGGYVSFGQGGCKITRKGTIKAECIVLGRDFKLLDDANILLRTPRQHNMYSIDLNNIVPHRDLTCLVAINWLDEVINSSVKNLVPIPSESEVTFDNESECDVPDKSSPIFTTFSNSLFDCNDNFTSCDDKSLSNEDVLMENFKIYSSPLFDDEEIISTKIEEADFDLKEEIRLV